MREENEAVRRAIAVLGSGVKLARVIGVHQSFPSQWLSGHRRVPADRCPAIERATNGAVRCEDLRPDVDWAYLRGTSAVNPQNPTIPERKAA